MPQNLGLVHRIWLLSIVSIANRGFLNFVFRQSFLLTVGTKKECGERILLVNPSFCGPNDKNFQGVKKGKY